MSVQIKVKTKNNDLEASAGELYLDTTTDQIYICFEHLDGDLQLISISDGTDYNCKSCSPFAEDQEDFKLIKEMTVTVEIA